jgi:hypothetical protein
MRIAITSMTSQVDPPSANSTGVSSVRNEIEPEPAVSVENLTKAFGTGDEPVTAEESTDV